MNEIQDKLVSGYWIYKGMIICHRRLFFSSCWSSCSKPDLRIHQLSSTWRKHILFTFSFLRFQVELFVTKRNALVSLFFGRGSPYIYTCEITWPRRARNPFSIWHHYYAVKREVCAREQDPSSSIFGGKLFQSNNGIKSALHPYYVYINELNNGSPHLFIPWIQVLVFFR
jgi:hypothetical protein